MSVYIENEYKESLPEQYALIVNDVVSASLEFIQCPYECEVNVLFTDDAGICEMNKAYRGIDAPTDVLSFPMLDYSEPASFDEFEQHPEAYFNQDTGELMLGDIVLNVNRIIQQAQAYGHTQKRELAFLVAHSMLHLAGYDHMDENERLQMEQLQEEILKMKGYTRENEEE